MNHITDSVESQRNEQEMKQITLEQLKEINAKRYPVKVRYKLGARLTEYTGASEEVWQYNQLNPQQ